MGRGENYLIRSLKGKSSKRNNHGIFRNQHQIPVPTMYNVTIFEKFLVRPNFGCCPGGRITIYGHNQRVPL